MNPARPESAQRIVADYLEMLARDGAHAFPASVRALPYPKETIKTAILTNARALRATHSFTDEMHEFLEHAYVALAEYVEDDVARVMRDYHSALTASAGAPRRGTVRVAVGRQLDDSSRLVAEITRSIAADANALRREFRARA